jgi:hypothetical protein
VPPAESRVTPRGSGWRRKEAKDFQTMCVCTLCAEDARTYEPSEAELAKCAAGYPPMEHLDELGFTSPERAVLMAGFARKQYGEELSEPEKREYGRVNAFAYLRVARHIFGYTGPAAEIEAWDERMSAALTALCNSRESIDVLRLSPNTAKRLRRSKVATIGDLVATVDEHCHPLRLTHAQSDEVSTALTAYEARRFPDMKAEPVPILPPAIKQVALDAAAPVEAVEGDDEPWYYYHELEAPRKRFARRHCIIKSHLVTPTVPMVVVEAYYCTEESEEVTFEVSPVIALQYATRETFQQTLYGDSTDEHVEHLPPNLSTALSRGARVAGKVLRTMSEHGWEHLGQENVVLPVVLDYTGRTEIKELPEPYGCGDIGATKAMCLASDLDTTKARLAPAAREYEQSYAEAFKRREARGREAKALGVLGGINTDL